MGLIELSGKLQRVDNNMIDSFHVTDIVIAPKIQSLVT